MTTYVYDIIFTVLDALGNPLPASDTEVDLRLPNGNFVPRTPSIDETLDTGMIWSYKFFGEGNVAFFQLPGNKGPYGVRILYLGNQVYYNIDEINVLEKTEGHNYQDHGLQGQDHIPRLRGQGAPKPMGEVHAAKRLDRLEADIGERRSRVPIHSSWNPDNRRSMVEGS
jgi:hypothetical protein